MSKLDRIEVLAKRYADDRALLEERAAALEDELRAVRRRHIRGLRNAANRVRASGDNLLAVIDAHRELFRRPRSRTLHGLRVGIRKGKGRLDFLDRDQVVRLIRRRLPDRAEELIKVEEKPIKEALARLPADELRRIGVTVVEAGDEVFISAGASDIDKMVDAWLSEQLEEETPA